MIPKKYGIDPVECKYLECIDYSAKSCARNCIVERTQEEVTGDMDNFTVARVSAQQAKEKVEAGSGLLVCAYDDEEKFKRNHLSGAIPLGKFRSKLTSIPKNQEIIFYCA